MDHNGCDIRALRLSKRLSQAKLALLLDVPQFQLSQWELGKTPIPANIAERICSVIGKLEEGHVVRLRKKRYQAHHYLDIGAIIAKKAPHQAGAVRANREYLSHLDCLEAGRHGEHNGKPRPNGIALFAGCGGMSLGFSWAGFHVRGFVELEAGFRHIYGLNFPEAAELGSDVRQLDDAVVEGWQKRFGKIKVLFGGPPCQGFSLTGKRDRLDPRNQLFRHFVRVAAILRPPALLVENVRLLTSMKSAEGNMVKDEITEAFNEIGYVMAHMVVDAQDYGVPQHRERVFFIGLRRDMGLRPSFPEPSHGASGAGDLFSPKLEPYRTFRVATCDLEPLESGHRSANDTWHEAVGHPQHVIEWLKDVPEGSSAHENPDPKMRPPSGYNTTYKRLRWDEPASTVGTTFGMISGCRNVHPFHTRSLTVREALRCQTFPDSFKLDGTLGSVRTSIGNAVPPLLAFALAGHIKRLLLPLD